MSCYVEYVSLDKGKCPDKVKAADIHLKRETELTSGAFIRQEKMGLIQLTRHGSITLLYGAKEERVSNAVALKEYLEERNNTRKNSQVR
jgi:uncharacterized protein YeaO (DUF488 family)